MWNRPIFYCWSTVPCVLAIARVLGDRALWNRLYWIETEWMNSSVSQEETGANEMGPVQAWVFLGPEERKHYKSFFFSYVSHNINKSCDFCWAKASGRMKKVQTTWIHKNFSCFYCLGQILSPPQGRVLLAGNALHHGSQRPWQRGRTPLGGQDRTDRNSSQHRVN